MLQETLDEAKQRMSDSVEALRRDMAGVRTGRASTGLVDNLKVDYFGSEMPLNQLHVSADRVQCRMGQWKGREVAHFDAILAVACEAEMVANRTGPVLVRD